MIFMIIYQWSKSALGDCSEKMLWPLNPEVAEWLWQFEDYCIALHCIAFMSRTQLQLSLRGKEYLNCFNRKIDNSEVTEV